MWGTVCRLFWYEMMLVWHQDRCSVVMHTRTDEVWWCTCLTCCTLNLTIEDWVAWMIWEYKITMTSRATEELCVMNTESFNVANKILENCFPDIICLSYFICLYFYCDVVLSSKSFFKIAVLNIVLRLEEYWGENDNSVFISGYTVPLRY